MKKNCYSILFFVIITLNANSQNNSCCLNGNLILAYSKNSINNDNAKSYLKQNPYTLSDYKTIPVLRKPNRFNIASLNRHDIRTYKSVSFTYSLQHNLTDTSVLMLKVKKRKFTFKNEPPKKIMSGHKYTEEFNSIIKTNPYACEEFKRARYYNIGATFAGAAFVGISAYSLGRTIDKAKNVKSGNLVSSSPVLGDLVSTLVVGGIWYYYMIKSGRHFKRGLKIFNENYY
ncbi:MAG: hypothetical protein K9I02_02980 [Haliscomenobacter sp.]|nr:hypothetical protein [Haliscomenobacter sp.]